MPASPSGDGPAAVRMPSPDAVGTLANALVHHHGALTRDETIWMVQNAFASRRTVEIFEVIDALTDVEETLRARVREAEAGQ